MSLPSIVYGNNPYVQFESDQIVLLQGIVSIKQIKGNKLSIKHTDGTESVYGFSSNTEVLTALSTLKNAFAGNLSLFQVNGVAPNSFNINLVVGDPSFNAKLFGYGFNANKNPYLQLFNGVNRWFIAQGSTTVTSQTVIDFTIYTLGDGPFNAMPAGTYNLEYYDIDNPVIPIVLQNAITLTAGGNDNVNPVKFDAVYHDPVTSGFVPIDQTKGCFWFGVNDEFYSWDPNTLTWKGIIVT